MASIKDIQQPVAVELKEFEKHFAKSIQSNVPLMGVITNYMLRRKGKMMRPLVVFLIAKLNGEINQSTYNAATLIELLHTATLVHDDVVDESYVRRGFLSINALWKSKVAVLLGDFLLAKGLLLSVDKSEFDLLGTVSHAVKEMSEGELLQIQKTRKLNIQEDEYYDIISKKTAALIASCSKSGAQSVGADSETLQNMFDLGLAMGIAFQIKDDLLDYEKDSKSGKPAGNDIQEKKLTLPIIYSLSKADTREAKRIKSLINKRGNTKDAVNQVFNFVNKYDGLSYATIQMNNYKQKALDIVSKYPESETKTSVIQLINFITVRNK